MDSTLVIGVAVVALGVGVGAFLMFGQRASSLTESASGPLPSTAGAMPPASGTIPPASGTAAAKLTAPSATAPRDARQTDVRIRWYQRVRSGLVLLLITVGLGMAVGAAIGSVALVVSLLMG